MTATGPTLAEQTLLALALHRMLTVEQLRELLTPGTRATTRWSARLNRLAEAGLVRFLRPGGARYPKVWCCTRAGLRAALGDPDLTRSYLVGHTGGQLVAHTLAVNEVGLAFVRAARARGDDCDWQSWEHEVAHTIATGRGPHRAVIADAVLTYTRLTANREMPLRRFIEVDRATQPAGKLAQKIRGYSTYHRWRPARPETHGLPAGQPAWRARYPTWPALCVIIGANPHRSSTVIERRIDHLLTACGTDPAIRAARIPILVCRYDQLTTRGPWSHIWRRADAPELPVDINGVPADTAQAAGA